MNPLLSERVLGLLPDHDTANALRAILQSTASPTLLQAGTALNVIPGEQQHNWIAVSFQEKRYKR
jgi:hypothetical protein